MHTPSDTPVTDDEKVSGEPADAAMPEESDLGGLLGSGGVSGVPAEPSDQAISRLEAERDALQDRYVRLAAEYDNFRKRSLKEREELTARSQAALASRLLDVLDDVDRLLAGERAAVSADSLFQGMELVGRKLWKELEVAGLERLDPQGAPFDPALHEAVATTPPTDPTQDHTVCRTFQAGYRFKGALLRPARVQVYADPGQA
jgi:molecular chaperone GrpE